ncbi:MAG: hypothetical protein M1812_002365 [Candelaria pacifica]|nr:MAG: hypothetical protein M1812_002365 [Candelaria pacifica]
MSSNGSQKTEAKITLYWLEKSRAQRILWLLEELKLPYELKTYKRGEDRLAPPELREVHPLGKSPVISIETPATQKPMVIAESGLIVEYLIKYFGSWLAPKEFQDGKEGQAGGETEEWMRYRFFMHYAEGSLMPLLLITILVDGIKGSPVPFFIKPITGMIAGRIETMFLNRSFKTHFEFLESQIASSPNSGEFLCGKELTGADVLMSFPLEAGQSRAGLTADKYPKLCAYLDKIHERDAYKRAVQKIVDMEGSYNPNL